MRYLPGEAPGHQGTVPTRCRRAHTQAAPSRSDSADEPEAAVHEPESTTLNISLADVVRESDAPGDDEHDNDDYEELDDQVRSDEEPEEELDAEDAEEWVDEDGDLGPEDGEAEEDDGYDDLYAPF